MSINKSSDAWGMVLTDAHRRALMVAPASCRACCDGRQDVLIVPRSDVDHPQRSMMDRLGHTWELALSGLRRGEIAGLRWSDIDFDAKTLTVVNNRTDAGGTVTKTNPKTATSRRTLPLPDRLVTVLRSAKARQARERPLGVRRLL